MRDCTRSLKAVAGLLLKWQSLCRLQLTEKNINLLYLSSRLSIQLGAYCHLYVHMCINLPIFQLCPSSESIVSLQYGTGYLHPLHIVSQIAWIPSIALLKTV